MLFVDKDDCSLGPLFKAIVQQAVRIDAVLSTVGLIADTAGIEFPGTELNEGKPPTDVVCSALNSLGFSHFQHSSKSVRMHPELVHWADLILVPALLEEDLLCLDFHEAWSKTLQIECYCGKYAMHITLSDEATEKEYLSASEVFKALLPDLISRIKDSYANALIAKGVCINKGTVIGNAYIAKYGKDLYNFTKGDILIIDRAGTLMFKDIDRAMATSIINKFAEPPYEVCSLEEMIAEFSAKLKPLTAKQVETGVIAEEKPPGKKIIVGGGLGAFSAVLTGAKALVCSRGRHSGEHLAVQYKIPCISSCVGATEYIVNDQLIVVDAERGNVYDASLLRSLC